MTRDEAKSKLLEATANECTVRWMEDFIDSAVALGLLKLDEPKFTGKLTAALMTIGISIDVLPIDVALDRAGLRIVEK